MKFYLTLFLSLVAFAQVPAVNSGTAVYPTSGTIMIGGNNLSEITTAATARANLGLGAAAVLGTPITGANGGTGVANTGFTITLAGNLVTTGAFNTTFAQGATTTVTLPTTSSTMARTDAGQTFTGTQVFSSPILGTSGGTGVNNGAFTITLAGNLATTGAFNTTFAQGATTTQTLPTTSQTIPGMNQTNTAGASMVWDLSAASVTGGLKIPATAGAAPTADDFIAFNTTNHTYVWGSNGTTLVGAVAATGTGTVTTCTNQYVSVISSLAVPTCATVTLGQLGYGLETSITSASGSITNTETQVVGLSIPANTLIAGTTFHIHASGNVTTSTTPGNDTFRVRIGTTTLTGNIPVTVAAAANASVTTQPFTVDAFVTVRTNGAGGTIIGDIQAFDGGPIATGAFTSAGNGSVSTSTVVVDTTATKILELTFQSGAASSSATFQTAIIELVKI